MGALIPLCWLITEVVFGKKARKAKRNRKRGCYASFYVTLICFAKKFRTEEKDKKDAAYLSTSTLYISCFYAFASQLE
ncbi:hypothetical protein A3850_009330 [Lewinella sp. 4G2]|nr:hypothetical protein A3850_009330 [Lewinella sp. 4G2]